MAALHLFSKLDAAVFDRKWRALLSSAAVFGATATTGRTWLSYARPGGAPPRWQWPFFYVADDAELARRRRRGRLRERGFERFRRGFLRQSAAERWLGIFKPTVQDETTVPRILRPENLRHAVRQSRVEHHKSIKVRRNRLHDLSSLDDLTRIKILPIM